MARSKPNEFVDELSLSGSTQSPEKYSLRSRAPAAAVPPPSSPTAKDAACCKTKKRRKIRSMGLKRRSRVKKGVCGDVKIKSTRKKLTIRANAPSAIKSKVVLLPARSTSRDKSSPTEVVIKVNPLFTSNSTCKTRSFRHLMERENKSGNVSDEEHTGEGFRGQQGKIRKTKEKEMISAIMGISKCNSRKGSSVFGKIKHCMGSRKGASDISTRVAAMSPKTRGGINKLRDPLSPKITEMQQILTQI